MKKTVLAIKNTMATSGNCRMVFIRKNTLMAIDDPWVGQKFYLTHKGIQKLIDAEVPHSLGDVLKTEVGTSVI